METAFFSSFLDTVAATHDKNRFQSNFCCRSFLSCCPDVVVLHMCELIHLIVWEAKKLVVSHPVVSCRIKASSHIGDTTRHDTMRHDPFFRSPYNQMDQFTHMQHDQVWSSRQKAATTKIVLEAIFVVCRSDSIKKIAKENIFHRNLTWIYKFMTQE